MKEEEGNEEYLMDILDISGRLRSRSGGSRVGPHDTQNVIKSQDDHGKWSSSLENGYIWLPS